MANKAKTTFWFSSAVWGALSTPGWMEVGQLILKHLSPLCILVSTNGSNSHLLFLWLPNYNTYHCMSSLGVDERFNLSHKSQILFFLLKLGQYPAVLLRTSVSSLHTEYHGDNHYLSPQVPIRVRACRPHHELEPLASPVWYLPRMLPVQLTRTHVSVKPSSLTYPRCGNHHYIFCI